VRVNQIAREYAKAIMQFAFDDYDNITAFMTAIIDTMRKSKDFSNFLLHPGIPLEDKMTAVLKLSEKPVIPVVRNTIEDLVNRRGIELIPLILDRMSVIFKEKEGIQDAFISSAYKLNEEQKQQLTEALEKYCGKKVEVSFSIDEKLIAGYKVKIDNRIIDNSVQRQLEVAGDLLTVSNRV
jgi:F-type H+-transporting ATPase subunit delta